VYRSMAVLGAEGFGALPRHCALLMGVLFGAAIGLCAARDALPRRYGRFVPSPMAMGIPFYLGADLFSGGRGPCFFGGPSFFWGGLCFGGAFVFWWGFVWGGGVLAGGFV
jgi:hypothetical protein